MYTEFEQSLKHKTTYNIDYEIHILCELKDIDDELQLLLRVFENQRDVLEKFARKFWEGGQDGWKQLRNGFVQDSRIDTLMKRVSKLNQDAQLTKESVSRPTLV